MDSEKRVSPSILIKDAVDSPKSSLTCPHPPESQRKLIVENRTASVADLTITDSMASRSPLNTALATRSDQEVIAALKQARPVTFKNVLTVNTASAPNATENHEQSPSPSDEKESSPEQQESSSSDEDVQAVSREKKVSLRKQRQNGVHQNYILTKIKGEDGKSHRPKTQESGQQSARWLAKQSVAQNIICTPREYQVELFERAKNENIIAVLGTGSGKTLIAVLLLRHMIQQEMIIREAGGPKKIAFFLVDSVALVFQQFAVLDANLDFPKEMFCGNMISEHGAKRVWDKAFSENMIIVCMADVLNQCLHHSFISMDRINLLVFDEAHHAKKNHVYARIIKDFYVNEGENRRPKIFGMTASPADTKSDVAKTAAELESLLHCKIATAPDSSLSQFHTQKDREMVAQYDCLRSKFKTPLYLEIEHQFNDIVVLKKPMLFSYEASSNLGVWCSNQMWSFCVTDEEVNKLKAKTDRKFLAQKIVATDLYEAQIKGIDEAQKTIRAFAFPPPQPNIVDLSPKVLTLMDILQDRFDRPNEDKCIVFVNERYTARLLAELFTHPNIGTQHLRVGTLVGIRASSAGDIKTSLREQIISIRKFRQGVYNCMFATSVAEEGLDIPDCNLIIRFDLYRTVTQYIQSRGRARHKNSSYIHMKEKDNRKHTALIREAQKDENLLRDFCQALPEDRILRGNDFDLDVFLAKEKTHRVYTEPDTGAKLTYRMSLVILANFVSSLPNRAEAALHPEYVMMVQNKNFVFEVILPESSPIARATGRPHTTKQVAKCAAAFEACLALRKGGHINEYLQSTYNKLGPAMRNAHLAVSSHKKELYDMRVKPSIWDANEIPTNMHMSIFSLANPSAVGRPTQPLGILTRRAVPEIPNFPLYFKGGGKSAVMTKTYPDPLEFTTEQLALLDGYTRRIFMDVFSKTYESEIHKMPYFFVPLTDDNITVTAKLSIFVDWAALELVQKHERLENDENTPDEWFKDRYIVDPYDGSRKMWSHRVTHKYKPLDPVPTDAAPRKPVRKNVNDNIMEYSTSLWNKARSKRTFKTQQQVIKAELISLKRNMLDDSYESAEAEYSKICYIIPEALLISALSTKVVAMAYLMPAILHRLDSYLIALEACEKLHLNIPAELALEAMTKDTDNSEEATEKQIQVQRGMGKNYERLEFLGDCFLKMGTSIAIYTQHPADDECAYHVKRMLLICNKNLLQNAINLKLYEYIRSASFNRRSWYPQGLKLIKGKDKPSATTHRLGDKTIADVSEALIGAALLAHHETGKMDEAVRAVTELVCSTDHTMTSFAQYFTLYDPPKYQLEKSTVSQRELARKVSEEYPYVFKYPRLLRSAFVHPSYPFAYEHVPSYQRLEFLGDSLLDMACINYLFHAYPDRNPQWLTEHKMAMVSNQFLGLVCVSLGFHAHLLSFSSAIQSSIVEYVTAIEEAREEAEDEAVAAGKPKEAYAREFWVNTKPPPKCLPDIVEAYVGAMFVDSEYDYSTTEKFFDSQIKEYFLDMHIYDTFANKHPVTYLNRLMVNMGCASWGLQSTLMPDLGDGAPRHSMATVTVHDTVIADHEAESGRYAKEKVSKKALGMLEGISVREFRGLYHCDCKVEEVEESIDGKDEFPHGTAV